MAKKTASFAIGAAMGALIGGITVALTTPKSGKEMREDLKTDAEKLYDEGKAQATKVYETSKDKATKVYETSKDKATQVYETSRKTVESTVDTVKEKLNKEKTQDSTPVSTTPVEPTSDVEYVTENLIDKEAQKFEEEIKSIDSEY